MLFLSILSFATIFRLTFKNRLTLQYNKIMNYENRYLFKTPGKEFH